MVNQIEILGDIFNYEICIDEDTNKEYYSIFHDKWSLASSGDNLNEAMNNIIKDMHDIFQIYIKTPSNELSEGAIEFIEYLLERLK